MCGDKGMAISYKRLWKTLIDKDMKKKDLCELANISTYTIGRMNRDENVTLEIIERICRTLQCEPSDVFEFVDKKTEGGSK